MPDDMTHSLSRGEQRFPVTAEEARYIKLGVGDAWFESCRRHGRMEFGHRHVPHELALTRDKEAIAQIYRGQVKATFGIYL